MGRFGADSLLHAARSRGVLLLGLAAAAVAAAVNATGGAAALRYPSAHTGRFACTMLDTNAAADGSTTFTCETDAGSVLEGVARSLRGAVAGTRVLLRGRIEPFDGPRNPGEPDMAAIERERGIDAQVQSAQMLRVLPPGKLTLRIAFAQAHAWALAQLRLRMGEPYASILAGELWGERSSLSPDLRAEFQQTGTVHILVTAGLHLGVVALFAVALLRRAGAPRLAVAFGAMAAIWSYAAFSGMHLPSMRAATMISFGLGAYAYGASPLSWNAYGAALLGVAVFTPDDVGSASFDLSFSCVGAILLLAEPIGALLETFALPERVREALVLSIATQIGTWPLTAATFLLFAPYAVFANLLVVPVVGATMALAALQFALFRLPELAQAAANADSWLLAWIVSVVSTVSSLPGAGVPMTPAPAWSIAAYEALLVAAAALWHRGARTAALCALLLGFSTVVSAPPAIDTDLRITVLDVGQADGIVIQTPAGNVIMVDAGGRLERGGVGQSSAEQVGQRIVVPYLRRAGIDRIDALILSHPHGDHAGGMAPVMRSFGVTQFADGGQKYGGYAYNDALRTARTDRIPIVYPRAGAVWRTNDGVTLTFIGPSLPFIQSNNAINDNSVAFILQYKHFRMLFTGDAGVAAEERFLNEGIDLHADVLKVGHHGSAYSSSPAFIAAVHPKYAIVSVGRHNMFGHPAPSTIDTLHRFGAHVYRTDENGAVSLTTNGTAYAIAPMLRPAEVREPPDIQRV